MKQELEYIKINSSIHRLNPTFKLLYLLLYLVICFLPYQIDYLIIASFLIVAFLLISSRVPLKFYLNNIYHIFPLIIALFIILASFSYTLIASILIALKLIFAICLFTMIIYTTTNINLSIGIYNILKHLNILGINQNILFIKIYNLVSFKQDYVFSENQIIEGLEIKGENIRHKDIISRFFTHLNLIPLVLRKRKKVAYKRKNQLLGNGFDIETYLNTINHKNIKESYAYLTNILQNDLDVARYATKVGIWDFVYFFAFILLIVLYLMKVI